jgi:hypothetical protein
MGLATLSNPFHKAVYLRSFISGQKRLRIDKPESDVEKGD